MPYTHSLVVAIGWAVLAGLVCQLSPALRGGRTGLIVGLAVFSHWILDLIVHRPDLALYDSTFKMGFGLWNHRALAFGLEIVVLICGAALFLRATSHKWRIVGFVCLLVLIQVVGTFFFPPPTSDRAAALTALSFYGALVLIAWWAE